MHHGCVLNIKQIVRLNAILHRNTLINVTVQRAIAYATPPHARMCARVRVRACCIAGGIALRAVVTACATTEHVHHVSSHAE